MRALILLKICYGDQFGDNINDEIAAKASLHYLGKHYADKFFRQGQLEQLVMSALTGRNDGGCDDNCSEFVEGPDVDEDTLIEEKTEFEKTFILKHKSLFSESLSPDRFIRVPPMCISLQNNPNKASDPALYRFKP